MLPTLYSPRYLCCYCRSRQWRPTPFQRTTRPPASSDTLSKLPLLQNIYRLYLPCHLPNQPHNQVPVALHYFVDTVGPPLLLLLLLLLTALDSHLLLLVQVLIGLIILFLVLNSSNCTIHCLPLELLLFVDIIKLLKKMASVVVLQKLILSPH